MKNVRSVKLTSIRTNVSLAEQVMSIRMATRHAVEKKDVTRDVMNLLTSNLHYPDPREILEATMTDANAVLSAMTKLTTEANVACPRQN